MFPWVHDNVHSTHDFTKLHSPHASDVVSAELTLQVAAAAQQQDDLLIASMAPRCKAEWLLVYVQAAAATSSTAT